MEYIAKYTIYRDGKVRKRREIQIEAESNEIIEKTEILADSLKTYYATADGHEWKAVLTRLYQSIIEGQ